MFTALRGWWFEFVGVFMSGSYWGAILACFWVRHSAGLWVVGLDLSDRRVKQCFLHAKTHNHVRSDWAFGGFFFLAPHRLPIPVDLQDGVDSSSASASLP